ncbi:plakophilin-3-like, partial [Neolamprologus brichardi]|uniref:plakophilin-3-like n=1 Tax=Neolamprologus brichardi TaxID=32507 RepID=UPI0016439831
WLVTRSLSQVRVLQGVPALVQLFSSDNQEVKRYATAATRNLIYESAENKVALIDAGGLTPLISLLNEPDEELRKTITGVLWNLSSRDNLKEKLSREALPVLTQKVLIPLCRSVPLSPSERDIFNSTTGCLSLSCLRVQGLENSLCVMRNLSYQLYSELPPSVQLRLEGPSRASANREIETIGCFTLYSKKNVEVRAGGEGAGVIHPCAKNMVGLLVSKLPADGLQTTPSSDVVVNLCGALNHLVTCSSSAARDVCHFNGIPKLVGIKTSHDSSSGSQKAARAASTVLCNMFQYKKLHRDYRLVSSCGIFTRFIQNTLC